MTSEYFTPKIGSNLTVWDTLSLIIFRANINVNICTSKFFIFPVIVTVQNYLPDYADNLLTTTLNTNGKV